MVADYHIHTPYCGHARGMTIEYAERAVELGFNEICFTDHLDRYYLTPSQRQRYQNWGMSETHLERYLHEVEDLRAHFAGTLDIRIGLEVDFIEGAEHLLRPHLKHYPFDFILGSIHCLPSFGWHHFSRYAHQSPARLYRDYLNYAHAATCCGLFDSLAHLDFIWRAIPWPPDLTDEIVAGIDAIVAAAGRHDIAVEINTNGFLWSALDGDKQPNPFKHLVRALVRHQVPVTIGSDAHSPDAVGTSFKEIVDYLAEHGVQSCRRFRRRKATTIPLIAT